MSRVAGNRVWKSFYNLYPVYAPYTVETIQTRIPISPIRPPGGSLRSSRRAGSAQPITFSGNEKSTESSGLSKSEKNQVQHQLMVAYWEVLSSPVQTIVIRSKSQSTPCTSLTSSLSQPFASSTTMYARDRATSSSAPVPRCRYCRGYKTASWPAPSQKILSLAGNVTKERPVAFRGAAGDMGVKQPPSCSCHEGEEGVHVDQLNRFQLRAFQASAQLPSFGGYSNVN